MDLKTLLVEVEKSVEQFNLTAGPNTAHKKNIEAKTMAKPSAAPAGKKGGGYNALDMSFSDDGSSYHSDSSEEEKKVVATKEEPKSG